jgi:hypothetical protein
MANIQNVRAINTPQKSYMWEITITGGVGAALPELAAYAKTVSIPQSAVEQIIINHKASKAHHAGRDASAHTLTLTFWDDEAQTIHKYFSDWLNTIHNELTGGAVSKDVYSALVTIKLRDTADTADTSVIKLAGAFPMDLSDIALSYDTSEPVEISVTMSYDSKVVE